MSAPEAAIVGSQTIATITVVARTMYPHDALPDDVYARVGQRLAELAADDASTAESIGQGVSALNAGRLFADLSAGEKLAAVQAIEGTEFFELVRSTAVVEVYSDARTWALCGYEGPSFDKGGYIHRGFNDLDWLPDPEAAT